jgi:hypothetical protein
VSVAVGQDRVSNARLRREFLERRAKGWLTSELVAERLGWRAPSGRPDGSRVLRQLGISVSHNTRGKPRRLPTVSSERAAELARAMNLDPVDCDL